MWQKLKSRIPKRFCSTRMVGVFLLTVVTIGAYCLGRQGGLNHAGAQSGPINITPASKGDYGNRVVAYVYNNVPISREDLGEYLIARFGAEKLELLINRKIVEMACQSRGIVVTDAEVTKKIQDDIRNLNTSMTMAEFERNFLKKYNKSMYEWREDVVRPQLMMNRLAKAQIEVTPEDLKKAYEAAYGPKVQCRMIVLQKEERKNWPKVYEHVRQSEAAFAETARKQFIPELASKGGEIPPIYMHFQDKNLEREAFSLKPGEVGRLVEMPDGTGVIFKCDQHLPQDSKNRFEDVRVTLHNQVEVVKLNQKIQDIFKQMRAEARPVNLLQPQVRQNDLEQSVRRELSGTAGQRPAIQPVGGTAPNGNQDVVPAGGIPVAPLPNPVLTQPVDIGAK